MGKETFGGKGSGRYPAGSGKNSDVSIKIISGNSKPKIGEFVPTTRKGYTGGQTVVQDPEGAISTIIVSPEQVEEAKKDWPDMTIISSNITEDALKKEERVSKGGMVDKDTESSVSSATIKTISGMSGEHADDVRNLFNDSVSNLEEDTDSDFARSYAKDAGLAAADIVSAYVTSTGGSIDDVMNIGEKLTSKYGNLVSTHLQGYGNDDYELIASDAEQAFGDKFQQLANSFSKESGERFMETKKFALETTDIDNVELLAKGKWKSIVFDDKTMEGIIANAQTLKGVVDIPVKLGHDDNQPLELPSAGWVTNLRMAGEKLVGDLKKVPKKIADMIKTGGYNQVSAEVWKNYYDEGLKKTFSHVLSAVALLGTSHKAITSLKNLQEIYQTNNRHSSKFESEIVCYSVIPAGEDGMMRIVSQLDSYNVDNKGGREDMANEPKPGIPEQVPPDNKEEKVLKPEEEIAKLREELNSLKVDLEIMKRQIAQPVGPAQSPMPQFPMAPQTPRKFSANKKEEDTMEGTPIVVVTEKEKELQVELDKAKEDLNVAKETIENLSTEARSKEVDSFISAKITEGKMKPKDKEAVKILLLSKEATETVKLSVEGAEKEVKKEEILKSLFNDKLVNFSIVSESGGATIGSDPAEKYEFELKKIQKENPTMTLESAMIQASKAVPDYVR